MFDDSLVGFLSFLVTLFGLPLAPVGIVLRLLSILGFNPPV